MSKKIVKEWIQGVEGKMFPIGDNDMSRVIMYTDGACIVSKYDADDISDVEYEIFDIPSGMCVDKPYSECVEFLKGMGHHPTNESNTQTLIREVDDDTFRHCSVVMVQYYEPDNPENSIKLYDENGNLLYRDSSRPFEN